MVADGRLTAGGGEHKGDGDERAEAREMEGQLMGESRRRLPLWFFVLMGAVLLCSTLIPVLSWNPVALAVVVGALGLLSVICFFLIRSRAEGVDDAPEPVGDGMGADPSPAWGFVLRFFVPIGVSLLLIGIVAYTYFAVPA